MKRGRGRGRGGRGGQAQAIKNLERAAADIQNMLQNISVAGDQDHGSKSATKRRPDSRGSRSLMDLNVGDGAHRSGPPIQDPYYRGPPHQDPYYTGPPDPGPYFQGSPLQGHYNQGSPHHSHYDQGPPHHGHYNQGPPLRGHYNQGPPHRGHYNQGSPGPGPYPREQFHGSTKQYPPPPPSYEESMQQSGDVRSQSPMRKDPKKARQWSGKGAASAANVMQLVKALSMFNGQMADSETLGKQIESTVEEVEKIVKQRKDLFSHMKDGTKIMVELVPNVKLCSHYHSEKGCAARDTCQSLHLCKDYILTRCEEGPTCAFGHKFDTNHNSAILSKFYLDLIRTQYLVNIIRKVCRGNAPPRICSYHSTKDGCRKGDGCRFLHICKDYVMNDGNCPTKGCPFNHQLNTKQCKNVLTQHGMSTNESVRDILLSLKSSMEKTSGAETKKQRKNNKDDNESSDSDSSMDFTFVDQSDLSVKKKSNKPQGKKKEKSSRPDEKAKGKRYTIKSTDFNGDVEIPEICIYGVNDKCTNEMKGCKYLHAKSLFHWQVEKENKWYNFRIFQSKTLESAYRDVTKGGVKLPSIDAEKLNPQDKQILQLFGTHNWRADFKEMCITDAAKNKLNIRRVSTASSVVSSVPQATVYEWYFEDEQGKWIPYGNVDSLGKQNYVCNITSEDIEKQYLSDPTSTMMITNTHFKYKIDFKNMTQTNLTSMKVREIRRRPAHLSYQRSSKTSTSDASLPKHWKAMSSQQTHSLVTVDPNQEEFQDVSKSIKLMIPTARIHEIRRLQNEYLWRILQSKKTDLSSRYDDLTMNVQKLFHGTGSSFIDAICKENIDGRRYANAKEKYGKGTYFSNSCAIARTYCTPDAQGHLFLVLAEVIIGYVTPGSKGLNRPPPNPSTGFPYDTTVDSMTAPTIFVKYEKEEYYPEYIIEISV